MTIKVRAFACQSEHPHYNQADNEAAQKPKICQAFDFAKTFLVRLCSFANYVATEKKILQYIVKV